MDSLEICEVSHVFQTNIIATDLRLLLTEAEICYPSLDPTCARVLSLISKTCIVPTFLDCLKLFLRKAYQGLLRASFFYNWHFDCLPEYSSKGRSSHSAPVLDTFSMPLQNYISRYRMQFVFGNLISRRKRIWQCSTNDVDANFDFFLNLKYNFNCLLHDFKDSCTALNNSNKESMENAFCALRTIRIAASEMYPCITEETASLVIQLSCALLRFLKYGCSDNVFKMDVTRFVFDFVFSCTCFVPFHKGSDICTNTAILASMFTKGHALSLLRSIYVRPMKATVSAVEKMLSLQFQSTDFDNLAERDLS